MGCPGLAGVFAAGQLSSLTNAEAQSCLAKAQEVIADEPPNSALGRWAQSLAIGLADVLANRLEET